MRYEWLKQQQKKRCVAQKKCVENYLLFLLMQEQGEVKWTWQRLGWKWTKAHIVYKGDKLWNSLPKIAVNTKSLPGFRKVIWQRGKNTSGFQHKVTDDYGSWWLSVVIL